MGLRMVIGNNSNNTNNTVDELKIGLKVDN